MASRALGELGELGPEVGERIDVAKPGGLEQAAGVDVVLAEQIGDGAGDLDQAVDRASGDGAAPLDQLGEGTLAEAVELAGSAQDGAGHLGVAAQAPRPEPGELAVAGGDDAGADLGGGLAGLGAAQLAERDGADVDLEVDAVEQRAGQAEPVALDRAGAAGALADAGAQPAARAGGGGGDGQERGGEAERAGDAVDRDTSLLEWRAESLDGGARELGELVEEQHAVVGERDLAGGGGRATADQGGGRDRV